MINVYIPEIGDIWILAEDWEFTLYNEHRNQALVQAFNLGDVFEKRANSQVNSSTHYQLYRIRAQMNELVTLKAGTSMKVDRVYIRKGMEDFSSVSFIIQHSTTDEVKIIKRKPRFWAKLKDVNRVVIEE